MARVLQQLLRSSPALPSVVAVAVVSTLSWLVSPWASLSSEEAHELQESAIALSTLAMFVLFGTVGIVWMCMEITSSLPSDIARLLPYAHARKDTPKSSAGIGDGVAKAALPSPIGSAHDPLPCLRHMMLVACVLMACYVCEHWPLHPHEDREHSMDKCTFLCAIIFLGALLTVRRSRSDEFLRREQTEEWKGWMQMVFLLYHYFNTSEIYNEIRVMIACYVWMTGFGNWSFFAQGCLTPTRVLQALWRLNVSAVLLCWTMNTKYILYYIVPLHTFFFIFVFVVRAAKPSWNSRPGFLQVKLFIFGIIVFLVWDCPGGIFEYIFGWISREPGVGAPRGVLYEWYFRSYLDHWSALWGIHFASAIPVVVYGMQRLEKQSALLNASIAAALVLCILALVVYWSCAVAHLPKQAYNAWHPYLSALPLFSYVILRNMHSVLRCHHLVLFQKVGRVTLETYLLQHHVWLTSNSKSKLVLLPGFPFVNLVIVTGFFVLCANLLFHSTTALRVSILPDNLMVCTANLIMVGTCLAMAFLYARWLLNINAGPLHVCVALSINGGAASIAFLCTQALERKPHRCQPWRMPVFIAIPFVGCWLISTTSLVAALPDEVEDLGHQRYTTSDWRGLSRCGGSKTNVAQFPRGGALGFTNLRICCDWASRGHWKFAETCTDGLAVEGGIFADCGQPKWSWQGTPAQCKFGSMRIGDRLCPLNLTFAGDSTVRNTFFAFARLIGGENVIRDTNGLNSSLKHQDQHLRLFCGSHLNFLWRPFITDLLRAAKEAPTSDPLVLSGGLWDALHNRNVSSYGLGIDALRTALAMRQSINFWLTTTAVRDEALRTPEKRMWMKDDIVDAYRFEAHRLRPVVTSVLDTYALTKPVRILSVDGVHYPAHIDLVVAEVLSQTLFAALPARHSPESTQGVAPGGLGNPWRGLTTLVVTSAIGCILNGGWRRESHRHGNGDDHGASKDTCGSLQAC